MDDNPDALGRNKSVPVPRTFFEEILPSLHDLAEIKVLLTVYWLTATPPWTDGAVPEAAVYTDPTLIEGLRLEGATRPPTEDIRRGIELAAARGVLLRFRVSSRSDHTVWLMPASTDNRERLKRMQQGLVPLPPAMADEDPQARIEQERPNIFQLYEQNIGLVTPIIADQLIEALELYPEAWIEDAITEAVSYNRRQWRYVQRILERWSTEGRGDEAHRRRGHSAGSLDPEKYLRGKYASLFRRRR